MFAMSIITVGFPIITVLRVGGSAVGYDFFLSTALFFRGRDGIGFIATKGRATKNSKVAKRTYDIKSPWREQSTGQP